MKYHELQKLPLQGQYQESQVHKKYGYTAGMWVGVQGASLNELKMAANGHLQRRWPAKNSQRQACLSLKRQERMAETCTKKHQNSKFNESVHQIMQTSLVSGCLGQNHHSLKKNRKESAHNTIAQDPEKTKNEMEGEY